MSLEEAKARHKTAGRNDPCPCGSEKKYKRCHQIDDDQLINAELRRLADEAKAKAKAEAEAEAASEENKEKSAAPGAKKQVVGRALQKKRTDAALSRKGGSKSEGGKPQSLPRRGAV